MDDTTALDLLENIFENCLNNFDHNLWIEDADDALQGMILEGEPNTACLTFARQQWGIYRAQGYKLLKRAWIQIKDDVNETGIDRLELLAWSIQTLMSAAGQAKQQKNPGAVVACIKQLDWMTGLGINSTLGTGRQRRR
jgi:hypothetical protein